MVYTIVEYIAATGIKRSTITSRLRQNPSFSTINLGEKVLTEAFISAWATKDGFTTANTMEQQELAELQAKIKEARATLAKLNSQIEEATAKLSR